MAENNLETVDLLAELQKSTEYKAEPKAPGAPSEHTENATHDQPGGGDDTITDVEFVDEPGTTETPTEDTNPINAADLKKAKLRGKKLAPVIVDAFDSVQTELFPFLFERTLSDSDRRAMKSLARKYRALPKGHELILDEGDQRIMDIFIAYDEYCDEIPLTDDDKESLIEPLAEWIGEISLTQSPGGTLALALIMLLVSRLTPIGTNYMANKE